MKPHTIIPRKHKGEYVLSPLEVVKLKVFITSGKSLSQIVKLVLEDGIGRSKGRKIVMDILASCARQYPAVFQPHLLDLLQ